MNMDRIAGQLRAAAAGHAFSADSPAERIWSALPAAGQRNLWFLSGSPLRGMPAHRARWSAAPVVGMSA
jgi:hypothetical protein